MKKCAAAWKNDIDQNILFEPGKCIEKLITEQARPQMCTYLIYLSFSFFFPALFWACEKTKLTPLELI